MKIFQIILLYNYYIIFILSNTIITLNDIIKLQNNLIELKLTNNNEINYYNIQINITKTILEDIEIIKLNNNNENNNNDNIIQIKYNLLNKIYDKIVNFINDYNNNNGSNKKIINFNAAEKAIQRSKQRKLEEQRLYNKEKLEKEHLVYVSNVRKLELVDGIIDTLRQRAISLELSSKDMKELEGLFINYRQLEAQNIFNHTDFQKTRDYRLSLEKYIADRQNPLLQQKKRSIELIHRTLHEISSRALSTMLISSCEDDLKELNDLLVIYHDKSIKFIDIQHDKTTEMYQKEKFPSYGTLIAKGKDNTRELQHEISEIKRSIEAYLYNLQKTSKCE